MPQLMVKIRLTVHIFDVGLSINNRATTMALLTYNLLHAGHLAICSFCLK
jgi:hypothetical protein